MSNTYTSRRRADCPRTAHEHGKVRSYGLIFFLRRGRIYAMKYTELKKDLADGVRGIYLFEGNDAYFRTKGEEMIKNACLQNPEINYASFDGGALHGQSLTALTAAVRCVPLMSEKRVVRVKEFYPSASEYNAYLKDLFENFPSESVLIISNPESRRGCDLKRRKCVTYVDCGHAERDTVTKWIYLTFKRAGITASAPVCAMIAEYCLMDMARVSVEVEKLIDYSRSGELTAEDVDALVYKDDDYRMYEMTNALAVRNYSQFCLIAGGLGKKGSDELSLMSSMYFYLKKLLVALTWNGSDEALCDVLGVQPFAARRSREQAERLGKAALERYVLYIYSALSDVKSGLITPQSAIQKIECSLFFGS